MNIIGSVKTYDWGKLGAESKVAELTSLNSNEFKVDTNEPYAELWMGDHVSGPSIVKETNETLNKTLENDKSLIGGLDKLPFLFKVLSIRKALSIQIHPNKLEAKRLHAARPDLYKDDNHKPEMAIALTPFLALCGFRPAEQIYQLIKAHQPLVELIGDENVERINADGENGIRLCYSIVMRSKPNAINACISRLYEEFKSSGPKDLLASTFLKINEQFPDDVGSLSIFFLNLLQLNVGQAIFLSANVPHAYLSGDCIECMACSDNVIRAGLTPKFKDVDTLLEMLSYTAEPSERKFFAPTTIDRFAQLFSPPVDDFAIVKIEIPSTENEEYSVKNGKYGSIVIILSGERIGSTQSNGSIALAKGNILFVPATDKTLIIKNLNSKETFIAYQAMYNEFLS